MRTLDDGEVWMGGERGRGWVAGEDGDGVAAGEGVGEDDAAVAAGGTGDEDVHVGDDDRGCKKTRQCRQDCRKDEQDLVYGC